MFQFPGAGSSWGDTSLQIQMQALHAQNGGTGKQEVCVCHCICYRVDTNRGNSYSPNFCVSVYPQISVSQCYLESRCITWENLNSIYFTSKINSLSAFALFLEIIIFDSWIQNPNCYVTSYKITCHHFSRWKCFEMSLLLVLRTWKPAKNFRIILCGRISLANKCRKVSSQKGSRQKR